MPACREIINIQVGQAGNQVGEAFWETLLAEHSIQKDGTFTGTDPLQVERAGVYFTEVTSGGSGVKYVPRSVQVDLEAGVTNRITSGPLGSLFKPDTFITGDVSAGNNWAKGFYTEGAELVESITDVIRNQAEATDSLQGFQLIHSLGGGSGSGLGSLLLSKLREEYPERIMATFSVMPSPKVSETVVEPYNCLLALHQLIDTSDLTICLDNEALYDISLRTLKTSSPSFNDLNGFVAQVMTGVSTSLRFPGQLNGDLRKLATNLIPFPRLHFLMPSYAPFVTAGASAFQRVSVADLTAGVFDRRNYLVAANPDHGRYLTVATIFRGKVNSHEAEASVQERQRKNAHQFVEWLPDNVSVSLCSVPPVGQVQSATALANSTAMQTLFQRNLDQFSAMFKRKAFLHWYLDEGMDQMEFSEAESNAHDLVNEYQQYQEATVDDEGEFEEDGPAEEE